MNNQVITISRQKATALNKKYGGGYPLRKDDGSILLPYGCKLVRNNDHYVVYGYHYADEDCKRFCSENGIQY